MKEQVTLPLASIKDKKEYNKAVWMIIFMYVTFYTNDWLLK